jgi:hypothetical protein
VPIANAIFVTIYVQAQALTKDNLKKENERRQ